MIWYPLTDESIQETEAFIESLPVKDGRRRILERLLLEVRQLRSLIADKAIAGIGAAELGQLRDQVQDLEHVRWKNAQTIRDLESAVRRAGQTLKARAKRIEELESQAKGEA